MRPARYEQTHAYNPSLYRLVKLPIMHTASCKHCGLGALALLHPRRGRHPPTTPTHHYVSHGQGALADDLLRLGVHAPSGGEYLRRTLEAGPPIAVIVADACGSNGDRGGSW